VKVPVALVLCLVFAALGFLGGRLSGKAERSDAGADSAKQTGNAAGASRRDEDDDSRNRGMAGTKSERRSNSSGGEKRLADSLRELLATWNKPTLVLAEGDEREVLHTDLGELGDILAAINRADAADLAELRELLMDTDETTTEGELLNALLMLPLVGRDIELRGAAVLEETVEKAAVEEDDQFSEMLPIMLYTLTRKNPAEAEAWLKTFEARPDVDDFTVDVDELKAVVEKGKIGR
jgi:hypothetical protein